MAPKKFRPVTKVADHGWATKFVVAVCSLTAGIAGVHRPALVSTLQPPSKRRKQQRHFGTSKRSATRTLLQLAKSGRAVPPAHTRAEHLADAAWPLVSLRPSHSCRPCPIVAWGTGGTRIMVRATIVLILLALMPSAAKAEKRIALLIGNQSYT